MSETHTYHCELIWNEGQPVIAIYQDGLFHTFWSETALQTEVSLVELFQAGESRKLECLKRGLLLLRLAS